MIRKIHHLGYLTSGSIILKKGNGDHSFNLFEAKNVKVKELIVIEPGKSMSFQRHFKRNEIWLVSEGSCIVSYTNNVNNKDIKELQLNKFDHYLVPVGHWHPNKQPLKCKDTYH